MSPTTSRFLPKSVIGRVFMALLFAVIFINVTSLFLYLVFRDEAAEAAAAAQAADEIIVIKHMMERVPRDELRPLMARFNSPVMSLAITRGRPIVVKSENSLASRVVLNRLRDEFPKGTDIRVDSRIELAGFQAEAAVVDQETRTLTAGSPPPSATATKATPGAITRAWQRLFRSRQHQISKPFVPGQDVAPDLNEALFRVSIVARQPGDLLTDGTRATEVTWLNARVLLNLDQPPGQYVPFIWLTAISILVGLIAFWGVRRVIVPLSVFAAAAERLGVDVNAEPLAETGPSEVIRAAHAFNTMQTRIKRFIQDRTQMIAAISHDLRTPITRLHLRAEFVEDDSQRRKMLNDLDEMEAMISATLVFARDDAANEAATYVDAAAIIAALCSDQSAAGRDVHYTGPDSLELVARPLALKRAINNFVDNAVKYGKTARVTLVPGGEDILVQIDDDGPGIPPADTERAFAPFTRLERSRSRETGGTGLGMTIARNAIRSMGGDVALINRPEGGLRVKVFLPTAPADLREAAE